MALRLVSTAVLCAAIFTMLVLAPISNANAQGSAAQFTGFVTIDDTPAPAGTSVHILLANGDIFAQTVTGEGRLEPNLYRIIADNPPPDPDEPLFVTLPEVPSVDTVKVRFRSGEVIVVNLFGWSAPPGLATIVIPNLIVMTPNGTGLDSAGEEVISPGGLLTVGSTGEPILLPIRVLEGRTLDSFNDPESGVSVNRQDGQTRVRIAIKDAGGNDLIRVLAFVSELKGTGDSVQGLVESMGIDLPTKSRDFSGFDPRVGVGSVKVIADLGGFPAGAFLEMNLIKEPNQDIIDRMSGAARGDGFEISEFAFAIDFQTRNLSSVLRRVTLTVKISRDWLDSVGLENLAFFRAADDGTTQRIEVIATDPAADPAVFTLVSPSGFSTFGLLALKKAQEAKEEPTPTPTSTPGPTSMVVPTPTSAPVPTATSTRVQPTISAGPTQAPASAPTFVPTGTPVPLNQIPTPAASPTSTPEAADDRGSGGGCSAPTQANGPLDLGMGALLIGLLGLVVAGRPFRRR